MRECGTGRAKYIVEHYSCDYDAMSTTWFQHYARVVFKSSGNSGEGKWLRRLCSPDGVKQNQCYMWPDKEFFAKIISTILGLTFVRDRALSCGDEYDRARVEKLRRCYFRILRVHASSIIMT